MVYRVVRSVLFKQSVKGISIFLPGSKNIIQLDDVGSFIWTHLKSPISKAGLLKKMLKEYNIEKKRLSKDLDEFLEEMIKLKLIIAE